MSKEQRKEIPFGEALAAKKGENFSLLAIPSALRTWPMASSHKNPLLHYLLKAKAALTGQPSLVTRER